MDKQFVRRKSYMLDMGLGEQAKKDRYILEKGQNLIVIYADGGAVMGTFKTSMRVIRGSRGGHWHLYLTRVPQLPGEHILNDFPCGIISDDGWRGWCELHIKSPRRQLVFDIKTDELRALGPNSVESHKEWAEHRQSGRGRFYIEIIGGDYFHETDVKAILTMLENKVIPNDLVRMLKPFLY